MKIGVICPSEIAVRRFMPALAQMDGMEFAGVGVCAASERLGGERLSQEASERISQESYKKAREFTAQYGGSIFDGYEALVTAPEIEAVYLPLPPALHYRWAREALLHGKHVLVEKPSTTSAVHTRELVRLAEERGLALYENYMFLYHSQLQAIEDVIKSGEIGEIRLYRISFGFPKRAAGDFRYHKELGGGALIDAGGYTLRYAYALLGESARLQYARMNYADGYEVDLYGSGALINDAGVTVQVAFGMDNQYKCELEAWGSAGCLRTGRVLTAPAGFAPELVLQKGNIEERRALPPDDAFLKSLLRFGECVSGETLRREAYADMLRQAELVDEFKALAGEA